MDRNALEQLFNEQAHTYDSNWSKLALFKDALHVLMKAQLQTIPEKARFLCVGAGTGQEIVYLAQQFPHWHFTAVEPAFNMLEMCREQLNYHGLLNRCSLHHGYLDTLATTPAFDGASCLFVSHFLTDETERMQLFEAIGKRLTSAGIFINADLMADKEVSTYAALMALWINTIADAGASDEKLANIKSAYEKDVAILSTAKVAALIQAGGFKSAFPFFQSGLLGALVAMR
ncbi:class I SAM-dependent methyltransferase [Aestuariibacter sp. A3R04]|uniref:class I SAM-dependent methyltransferase n=1 Tax=Aestuariibacter sp. A3R04 TaxID=2841571 RepID=UPI001C095CD0|nr:class I SAM-dependent methyltransferase [Aestuariibacter sp. A3R04]MBU3020701.1 class I SAM-dependent methyltransferase [Aestuariibacter sp. A3R04]